MSALQQFLQTAFDARPDSLEQIASHFKPSVLKKNDFYLRQGQRCNQMSFIQSGMLRIFSNVDGKEITQWISTEGYFVTDLASFAFQTPARWSIQALADSQVFSIQREAYYNLGKEIPRWHEMEKVFLTHCFATLEDRVFNLLSMSAEERYHFFFNQNPELFNQVPLQYIASMLGMTPETFSRIRKKNLG